MTEKKLKSLEDHNSEKWVWIGGIYTDKPIPNGIACPSCGEEMMDSNPMMVLASIPPKKNIHCPSCGHIDLRIV
jgi:hypothetical protein